MSFLKSSSVESRNLSSITVAVKNYLNGKFSREEVNVEVVIDEDGTLYDFRVFDPFQLVDKELYVYADGWSNWLLEYRDNAGHDVDEILDEFDGVPQDD